MKSGLSFLVAARQCEITELEQLAQTGDLVGVLGQLTHALQRERGLSNVFLASQGERFAHQRLGQADACVLVEREVRRTFDQLDTDAGAARNGARLFSRIAVVLHALDALPGLRQRIAAQAIAPPEATQAFSHLIAGLLSVVFEAADTATDPEISRALVAMFNFMQGKEFAGQERAFGAAVFASVRIDAPGRHQWHDLIESQEACFGVFHDFADAAVLAAERSSQDPGVMAELERLRRRGNALPGDGRHEPGLSQVWYDCCTHRIDAMKTLEDLLSTELRGLCGRKITDAREQLRDQQAIIATLQHATILGAPGAPPPYGPHLERSILGMVQEQSRRLQAISAELDTVRASLNERKVVERAKGLLMARRQLSEEDAYRTLRQMAMNQNRKLSEVAAAVLAIEQALPHHAA